MGTKRDIAIVGLSHVLGTTSPNDLMLTIGFTIHETLPVTTKGRPTCGFTRVAPPVL
jgi:hypothetical protein